MYCCTLTKSWREHTHSHPKTSHSYIPDVDAISVTTLLSCKKKKKKTENDNQSQNLIWTILKVKLHYLQAGSWSSERRNRVMRKRDDWEYKLRHFIKKEAVTPSSPRGKVSCLVLLKQQLPNQILFKNSADTIWDLRYLLSSFFQILIYFLFRLVNFNFDIYILLLFCATRSFFSSRFAAIRTPLSVVGTFLHKRLPEAARGRTGRLSGCVGSEVL